MFWAEDVELGWFSLIFLHARSYQNILLFKLAFLSSQNSTLKVFSSIQQEYVWPTMHLGLLTPTGDIRVSQMARLLLLSRFSRVQLCVTPSTAPHQAPPPWDSPGKNTGVGCHFLLQCMKVKSESEVAQSCPTRTDPMDCSLPGSPLHGSFQARVLEWGAIAFSARWH